MASEPIPWSAQAFVVSVPVRDEHMGDILSTTDTHFVVVAGAHSDLLHYAEQTGQPWLIRADACIGFRRTNGKYGTLFPDLLVAVAVEVDPNKTYRIDQLGHPPAWLLEVLSDETANNDQNPLTGKLGAYAELGVREYVTFDPRPRKRLALKGYRLVQVGVYAPIPPHPAGGLWLETLALRVAAEPGSSTPKRGPLLRFYRADGTPLLHREEIEAQWRAEQTARQEAERQHIEAEQKRRAAERQRDVAEQQRAEAERREAAERASRLEVERRLAELEARLSQLAGEHAASPEPS
jgi:Uma2 family endonuclease